MIIAHQLARRNCPMVELLRISLHCANSFTGSIGVQKQADLSSTSTAVRSAIKFFWIVKGLSRQLI